MLKTLLYAPFKLKKIRLISISLQQESEIQQRENRSYFSLHCIHLETQLVYLNMEILSEVVSTLVATQIKGHQEVDCRHNVFLSELLRLLSRLHFTDMVIHKILHQFTCVCISLKMAKLWEDLAPSVTNLLSSTDSQRNGSASPMSPNSPKFNW